MKVVSFPKALLKTKIRQLSLSCAWDGHCLPSVSPRLAKLTASARIEVSMRRVSLRRKITKATGSVMWKDWRVFINMSTGMICIYFYVLAAKIGWDGWGVGPPRDFAAPLVKHPRKQQAESQCTCFQIIGPCLFLPRSLGR